MLSKGRHMTQIASLKLLPSPAFVNTLTGQFLSYSDFFFCANLAPFTEHLYNLSSCLCVDLLWKCVNNPTSTDTSLFNVEYHWAKGHSVAEDDRCECNAFETGSAEGKIALDLPLTSSSLSSVSLWKDTENKFCSDFCPSPPQAPIN